MYNVIVTEQQTTIPSEHAEVPSNIQVKEIEDPNDPDFLESYETVYKERFPEGERETLANLQQWLERKKNHQLGEDNYHWLVAKIDGKVVGMTQCHYMADVRSGFNGFVAVMQRHSNTGASDALVAQRTQCMEEDARQRGTELRHLFSELDVVDENDPKKRALKRLHWWKKRGVEALNMPWEFPRLNGEAEPTHMHLAARNRDPSQRPSFSREEIAKVIRAIYWSVYGFREHPNIDKLIAQIEKGSERIDPIELPSFRDIASRQRDVRGSVGSALVGGNT